MIKSNLIYWVKEDSRRLRSLKLTICSERDAVEIGKSGVAALRRERMQRLLDEAKSQGARLSYRDLSLILLTSKSTLKRDNKAVED